MAPLIAVLVYQLSISSGREGVCLTNVRLDAERTDLAAKKAKNRVTKIYPKILSPSAAFGRLCRERERERESERTRVEVERIEKRANCCRRAEEGRFAQS